MIVEKMIIRAYSPEFKDCDGWKCPVCEKEWYWFVEECHCGFKNIGTVECRKKEVKG